MSTAPHIFHQILAVARTELRLHQRQRGLLVITLGILVVFVLMAFGLRDQLSINMQNVPVGDSEEERAVLASTVMMISVIWTIVYASSIMILPITLAITFARDRRFRVKPLLDSTPLPIAAYLSGKLLGMWAAIALMLGFMAVFTTLTWWIVVAPVDAREVLSMWLLGALPMAVSHTGIIVMLVAWARGYRSAIIAAAAAVIALILLGAQRWVVFTEFVALGLPDYVNPMRPVLFAYFTMGGGTTAVDLAEGGYLSSVITSLDLFWTLTALCVQVLLLTGLTWTWMRLSNARH